MIYFVSVIFDILILGWIGSKVGFAVSINYGGDVNVGFDVFKVGFDVFKVEFAVSKVGFAVFINYGGM